jgi:mono/diheme cytochrome c family protein
MKKIFTISLLLILIAVIALVGFVKLGLPNVGDAPELTIEPTSERIARGEYLANHVTVCMDCHSGRNWAAFGGPLVPGTLGIGGEKFDQQMGFPGTFYAPNITPFNLKNWTDGDLFRLITTGVKKDGHPIFPAMPYLSYGKMGQEDIFSIITYLRTLPEQESTVPKSEADFPMNIIINTIPQKAEFSEIPAENDQIAYGKYLVNAAACGDCHTKQDKGKPVAGMEMAGGFAFKFPGGTTNSSNITPDKQSGIGNWTKEQFVHRFKAYADSAYKAPQLAKTDFQTVMPWGMYAGMKTKDLEAIYTYLQTIKPVNNAVQKFEALAAK